MYTFLLLIIICLVLFSTNKRLFKKIIYKIIYKDRNNFKIKNNMDQVKRLNNSKIMY